ncbi:MAG: hypothetical protein RL189_3172, partial [Pseudomonadota bacterium]
SIPVAAFSVISLSACKPREFNQTDVQSAVGIPAGFRSAALQNEWTGQLLLPAKESRADGAVYLKVHGAPDAHSALKGKIIRVSWPKIWGSANKFRPDVKFDAKELETAKKGGNIVPLALDGWASVSPLESLAAARCFGKFSTAATDDGKSASLCEYQPIDRIFVRIKKASLSSGQLVLSEDPIVIAGPHVMLVSQIQKTGRSEGNGKFAVYSANTFINGQFSASQKTEFLVEESFGSRPNFTFNNINSSPAGTQGWYIHGEFDSGVNTGKSLFVAKAIEPRAMLKVSGTYDVIDNKTAGQKFISYQDNLAVKDDYLSKNGLTRQKFASLQNNFRRLRILTGSSPTPLSEQAPIRKSTHSESNSPFAAGEKGLVVHLFHWITDAAGKKDVGPLGLVTGHYSYGFYEVVREPLTGELQFEVIYQQVYGQGPDGVVSSRISRTEYMGNFRRGWSNSIATSDVLIRTPWLNAPVDSPAGAPQAGYTPYDILNDSLSLMTQSYRTGSGDGISSITPWASCVQDSSQALFIALRQTEKLISATRGASYCSKNEFKGLCNMVSELKSNFEAGEIFENAPMRGDWLDNSLVLQIRRSSNAIENGYAALASYKTALPRHAFNLFLNTMLNKDLELLVMDNIQIGGYWTAAQRAQTFTPVPATTVFEVVKSAIEKTKGVSLKTLTKEEFVGYLLKAEGVKSLEELNHRFPNF